MFLALKHSRNQSQNQILLIATDNSTVVAYIKKKQRATHLAEMCALLWRTMTLCRHFEIMFHVRHIAGCLNVVAHSLSRSTQIQSTEWSLHPHLSRWFTPYVDFFAPWLNHKVMLYVSPVPYKDA